MTTEIKINRDTQEAEIIFGCQIIKRKIRQDEHGHEYFTFPNLLNHPELLSNQIFSYRIKDALDTIRNGDADALIRVNSQGFESVIRYLDREYGEKIRERFLEEWKDAKFAHTVLVNGCFFLDINGSISRTPHHFETQEQAEKYMYDIINKVRGIFTKYDLLSDENRQNIFEKIFSEGFYSFAEKEYFHYLIEKAFTGSARFPFKIAQIRL